MANLLTALRLLLILPVALALAGQISLSPYLLSSLILVAIATDYLDGKVARRLGTASPRGQLFDHATDFLFVTSGIAGLAYAGVLTPVLPVLIVIAFSQYVLDSHYFYHQKQLRMSLLGRWNGVFYFVPIVAMGCSGLPLIESISDSIAGVTRLVAWLLVLSTLASIVDRALAPLGIRHEADT